MRIRKNILFFVLTALMISSCNQKPKPMKTNILEKENLIAWCIVPFDAKDRSPEERAIMLEELGIDKLAYDYRDRHLPEFKTEIEALRQHEIDLTAVWLWIQDTDENLLDPTSEFIVKTVEEMQVKTEFWISFPPDFFRGLSEQEMFEKSVATLTALNERLERAGCSIALYNHGDWFGEPLNQIRIIEEIASDNIGMVYNFHHAHHEINEFQSLFPKILPYLSAVNLNGMTIGGEKIITLGEGEEELAMIHFMLEQGYDGPIGILGHTEGEDIKLVLERNLQGLEKIKGELKE